MKNILAISGSTRQHSTNQNYITAFSNLTKHIFTVSVFKGLSQLPHFNPDLDNENAPDEVIAFRKVLKAADGVLICTPEYAMGVPGSLKNALDWTVSSCDFMNKPTAVITASTLGQKAHLSLVDTLKIIDATLTNDMQVLIPMAKTKINNMHTIIDEKTLSDINTLISALKNSML